MNKVALISDIHFGVYANDIRWMDMQINYFETFFKESLIKQGITDVYILGDLLDNRKTLSVILESRLRILFKNTLSEFTFHHIVGNHDVRYKDSNQTHSLGFLEDLPNYTVHTDTTKFGDILFLPWLHKETTFNKEMDRFKHDKFKYCFAHLELNGFKLNKNYTMTRSHQDQNMLGTKFEYVFTGHYHTRSSATKMGTKIQYLGAPFALTRIDVDDPKGFVVLDLDNGDYDFIESEGIFRFINHDFEKDSKKDLNHFNNSFLDIQVTSASLVSPQWDIFRKGLSKYNIVNLNTITKIEDAIEVREEMVKQDNSSVETAIPSYINAMEVTEETKEELNDLMDELITESQFTH